MFNSKIKKMNIKNYPIGSAEYVVLHARKQQKRGRGLSLSFCGIKNPRKALIFAKHCAVFPKKDDIYLKGVDLSTYNCSCCGASKCKLWRPYQSFDITLLCVKCAGIDQEKDISNIDSNGMIESKITGRTDQIGWYIPAVPTEAYSPDYKEYWGYTTVPGPGVDWWKKLPSLPLEK